MTKTAYIGIFALLLMMFLVSVLLDVSKTDPVDHNVQAEEPDEPNRQPANLTRGGGDDVAGNDEQRGDDRDSGANVDNNQFAGPSMPLVPSVPPVPPAPPTLVDTPAFFTYTVQEGDKCWNLARKFYGSGLKWTQIKKDNPARVIVRGDVVNIREGAKLRIRKTTASAPAPAPAGSKQYTVKDGDKLWKIAFNFYGDGELWTKIRDANPGKVDKNGWIREGVTLLIPKVR